MEKLTAVIVDDEQHCRDGLQALLARKHPEVELLGMATNVPEGVALLGKAAPKLLFLDEPAAGMNPQETDHLMAIIRKIRDLDITVVLIEHDMKLVMSICDAITVLNYGMKLAQGTPLEIRRNQDVIEAYLGKEDA